MRRDQPSGKRRGIVLKRTTPAKEFDRYVRKESGLDPRLQRMFLGLQLSDFSTEDLQFLFGHSSWPSRIRTDLRAEAEARYEIVRKAAISELIAAVSRGYLRRLSLELKGDGLEVITLDEKKLLLSALKFLTVELDKSIDKDEAASQPTLDQSST